MRRIATTSKARRILLSLGLIVLIDRLEPSSNTLHASAFRFVGIHRPASFVGSVHKKQLAFPSFEAPRGAASPIFLSSNDPSSDEFAEARDGEAVQSLFAKYCDTDGLMTKATLQKIPAVAELLESGDLLPEEFDVIWDTAPKFPDVLSLNNERIDVDSFIQIYRDIDDLFEDDDVSRQKEQTTAVPSSTPSSEYVSSSEKAEGFEKIDEEPDETLEHELEDIFATICDKSGLISKDRLQSWDEIQKLFDDGLLGDDEFEDIWAQTPKSPGSPDQLDVDGFLSFNVALDDLFELGDGDSPEEEGESETANVASPAPTPTSSKMVMGDDLPPSALFAALAKENSRVGKTELKRWGELQEMLDEGDLSPVELQGIFERIPKVDGTTDQLDEKGFNMFYEAIDALFDYDENDEATTTPSATAGNEVSSLWRTELLSLLGRINNDPDRLPCGLECTELEERQVLKLVAELEKQTTNIIREKQGNIETMDLAGKWDLLYASSSAMKFNKGLSGLGGSFPNGRFAGLVQNLRATKFVTDVEYLERIEVNPSSASFDVKVTGNWDLRSSVSLFTGEPSLVLIVEPEKVTYGPTSTRADHWKSLGPLNMLDITYLDGDIRIMRGNTATDSIFVFRRSP